MSFIKYNSGIVLAARPAGIDTDVNIFYEDLYNKPTFEKQAKKIEKMTKNAIYTVVVGIAGDTFNENNDYWSWNDELLQKKASGEYTWQTWIGKPNCMDHKCESVLDHYGKVLDCYPNYPPKHIMMVLATDKVKSASLASGIEQGYIDKVSMSCEVEYSDCSYCGKRAASAHEYCEHIKNNRGRMLPVKKGMKHYAGAISNGFVKVGEICYGSTGREVSWVSNPAFPGCVKVETLKLADKLDIISGVFSSYGDKQVSSVFKKAASKRELSFDEKEGLKHILTLKNKSVYKGWIK